MNYKKIAIPCLFHNLELNTFQREEMGETVPDYELIEREIFFYNIDVISPRVDDHGIVIGSILYSGGRDYITQLTKHQVDEIIQKVLS